MLAAAPTLESGIRPRVATPQRRRPSIEGEIYLQAKRWEKTIDRPDIQQFASALQGQRARKGVFITTSAFSAEAKQYAERIDTRIILIDGPSWRG